VYFSADRFTRDPGDGVILRRKLLKYGVRLFRLMPHLQEITRENEFIHIIEDWQSQQYVEKLREASMRGIAKKIAMGIYPQGQTPYGYRLIGKKMESHLVVVDKEMQVVVWIFDWYYYQNIGCQEVADRLNAMGIPSRRRGIWTPPRVRDILGNEAYAGVWYANTWKRIGKNKKEKRPPEERTPIMIPALIPHMLWEHVREKLRSRQSGRLNENALMSCRARCHCGTPMNSVSVGNGFTPRIYHYYRCASNRYADGPCGAKQWTTEDVDETVWQFAYELLQNPEKLLTGYQELQEKQEEETERYTHQIEVLGDQIEEQKRVLTEMLEHRNATTSKSVREALDIQIEEYGHALDALEARRDSLIATQQNTVLTDDDIARMKVEIETVGQMLEALHTINEEADFNAKKALIEILLANLRQKRFLAALTPLGHGHSGMLSTRLPHRAAAS